MINWIEQNNMLATFDWKSFTFKRIINEYNPALISYQIWQERDIIFSDARLSKFYERLMQYGYQP